MNLTPKVNHKPLDDLNRHLDRKQQHVDQVQQHFNSHPLTIKVDGSQVIQASNNIQQLRREINQVSGTRINVSGNVTQPSQGRSTPDRDLSKSVQDLPQKFADAIKDELKGGIGGAAGGVASTPLKLAGGVLSGLLQGATFGIASEMTSDLGKGLSNALQEASGGVIGDSKALGKRMGQAMVEAVGSRLPQELKNELSQAIRQAMGEEDVLIASRSARLRQRQVADKQRYAARQELVFERRDVARAYEDTGSQGRQLERQRAEVQNQLASRESRLKEFQTRSFDFDVSREVPEGFVTTLLPQHRASQATKLKQSLEKQEAIYQPLFEQAQTYQELAKKGKPLDSAQQATVAEAKTKTAQLKKIQGRLEELEKPIEFGSDAEIQAEYAQYLAERQTAIQKQISALLEQEDALREQIDQTAKVYREQAERLKETQAHNKTLEPELPRQYLEVLRRVSGNQRLDQNLVPSLKVRDQELETSGQIASYSPERNEIKVRSELAEALKSGRLSVDQYKALVHELRHATQYIFGQLEGIEARQAGQILTTPTKPTLEEFQQFAPDIARYAPQERESEWDAWIYGEREAKAEQQKRSYNEALSGMEQGAGYGATGFEQQAASGLNQSLKSLEAIANLSQKYGVDFSQEIQDFEQSVRQMSGRIQSAMELVAKVHLEPTNPQQVETLHQWFRKEAANLQGLVGAIKEFEQEVVQAARAGHKTEPDPWGDSQFRRDRQPEFDIGMGAGSKEQDPWGDVPPSIIKQENQGAAIKQAPITQNINLVAAQKTAEASWATVKFVHNQVVVPLGRLTEKIAKFTGGALAKTVIPPAYKFLQETEQLAFDAIPMARPAKGLIKGVGVPTAAFLAAEQFVPGVAPLAGAASDTVSGLLMPFVESITGTMASGASSAIASGVPNVIGHGAVEAALSGTATSLIEGAGAAAGNAIVTAIVPLVGGRMALATAKGVAMATPGLKQIGEGIEMAQLPASVQKKLLALPEATRAREPEAIEVQAKALPSVSQASAEVVAITHQTTSEVQRVEGSLNEFSRALRTASGEAVGEFVTRIEAEFTQLRSKAKAALEQGNQALAEGATQTAKALFLQAQNYAGFLTKNAARAYEEVSQRYQAAKASGTPVRFGDPLSTAVGRTKSLITRMQNPTARMEQDARLKAENIPTIDVSAQVVEEAKDAGAAIPEAMAQGMRQAADQAKKGGEVVGEQSIEGLEQSIDMHSPPGEFLRRGAASALAYAQGMLSKITAAAQAGATLGKGVLEGVGTGTQSLENLKPKPFELKPLDLKGAQVGSDLEDLNRLLAEAESTAKLFEMALEKAGKVGAGQTPEELEQLNRLFRESQGAAERFQAAYEQSNRAGGGQTRSELEAINRVLRDAEAGSDRYDAAFAKAQRNATQEANRTNQAIAEQGRRIAANEAPVNQVNGGFNRFKNVIGDVAQSALALIGVFTLGDLIVELGRKTFSTALEFERLRVALDFSTEGQGAETLTRIAQESDRLGVSLRESAKGYQQFSAATMGTSLEGQTEEIFGGFQQAVATRALGPQQTESVYRALSQIASKGRVSLEELNQQLGEALPGALQTAARAMGMTTPELIALIESGNILAEDLLPKMNQQLRLESIGGIAEAAETAQAKLNRLNNEFTKLSMAIGAITLEGVKPGIDAATGGLAFLNQNTQVAVAGLEFLAVFLAGALLVGLVGVAKQLKLGEIALKTFGITARGTAGAMQLLGLTLKGLGAALAVTAAFEIFVRTTNQGSQEIKNAHKGISDSLDRIIDKERQAAEEARKRGVAQTGPGPEPKPEASDPVLRGIDWFTQPIRPLLQGFAAGGRFLAEKTPIGSIPGVGSMLKNDTASFAESELNTNTKRVGEMVAKSRESLGKMPILAPEQSQAAIAEIKKIDLEIQKKQGRQGILKLDGQTQEVQKLQQELDKLGQNRQKVLDGVFGSQAELQGQRDNLEKTRKELEAMRANPNDAVSTDDANKMLEGVNAQIAETDKRLNAMKAVADATAAAMTNLADKFNKVNAAAENAKFRSGLQLANNMTAIYNSQAQGNVSEAKAQDLTRTVEIQNNDQQIKQLQQDAQARGDIINQMGEGERVKLETYLGKPIEQAEPGDINLAKERVKLLKEELTGNQEAALAAQESIRTGQQETAQLQQQTAQIRAQVAEQKRQEQVQKALIGVRRIAAAQARDQFNSELMATQAQTQIYQLQAQGQVSEAQAQHLLVQAEQQSLQQRIIQFQQYAQQRQAIVDQLSAHERDVLERYLGTSLSNAGAEDIANAREQAQLDKVNLSPQQEKALAAQEGLKESQTQIAQAEQQLAQSQAQARERQRQLDEQIRDYYEQVAKTAKDMQRQLEDATLNATQVARDALLEVREIKSSTAFTKLKTRIARAMLGNTDDFMESFASSFEEYMSLTFEREQLSVDQLRNKYAIQDQIKDLKQSLADVMDQIRQTLIDMRRQLEELKRQIPTGEGVSSTSGGLMFPIAGKSATQNLTPGQGMNAYRDRKHGADKHNAQDYAYATGTPVVAPFSGTVARVDTDKGEYQVILRGINAQGQRIEAAMTHLSRISVKAGQSITMGQNVGAVGGGRGSWGSSGPHFHLGIKVNGRPVDPRTFFSSAGASVNINAKGSVSGLSAAQMGHVRTIVQVGQQRGASRRDILAALSTGLVESGLKNLGHGHLDSKGIFQQRPSQGWTNVTNVAHAAGAFYDTARSMGQGRNISAGELAARVQRPAAQYRGRYTQRMPEAQSILAALTGGASGEEAVESAHDKYMRIGYAAYRGGDLNTALINFKRAAREEPSSVAYTAMNNTAKALQARRRKRETPYDKAMRVGYEAAQEGDANTALINFQRAVKIKPTIKAQQARNNMRQALAAGGIKARPKGGRSGLDGSLDGLEGIAARGIPQLQAATGEAISAVSQKGQAQYQQSEADLENNEVMQELKRRGLFNQLDTQRQALNRERIDAISEAADRAAELEPDTTTKDVLSQARESTKAYRAPLREFNDRIGKLESGAESLRKMADVVARGGEGKPPDPALAKRMLELANSYDKADNSQKYLREQLLKQEGTARTQTVYTSLGKSIDAMAEQTQGAQRTLEGLQDQFEIDSPYSQFDQAMRGIRNSFKDERQEIEKTIETLETDYTAAHKAAEEAAKNAANATTTASKQAYLDESYYWTGYTKHLRANIDEQKQILKELSLTEDFARDQERRKFERGRDDAVLGTMERIGQFQQQVNPNADIQTDLNILGSYTTYEGLRRDTQDQIALLERVIDKKRASGKATDEETAALNYYKSVHKELHPIMRQAIADQEMLREALNAEEYLNVRVKLLEPILDLGQSAARNLKLRGNDFGAVELEKQVAIGQEDIRYKRQRVEIAKMQPELVQEFGIDEAQRKMDALYQTADRINQLNLDSINMEFKGLAATIGDTAKTALEGFIVDLGDSSKSIEERFKDMAKSILQVIAQLAARQLILGLFGNGNVPQQPSIAVDVMKSFLGSGSSLGSLFKFAEGGSVQAHMALKDAAQPTALGLAVMAGMSREGANAVPIVASIGEEVLSTRNSDAQFYRALKSQGAWEELKQGGVRNFALGGTVQSIHDPSPRYRAGQRVKQGDTTVTVIQNITTQDANSFRRSEGQMAQDSAYRTRRAYERNG